MRVRGERGPYEREHGPFCSEMAGKWHAAGVISALPTVQIAAILLPP